MKQVVFLGSKEIGLKCLDILNQKSKDLNYEIAGVLTNSRGKKIIDFCKNNNIRLISSLNEYLNLPKVDLAISVQYHEILKKIHIDKADEITVNLHMAPLPEYRGCNQFSYAIIEGVKEFGTTIHVLEEGIDSGSIISEKRFGISDDIWVDELYNLTFEKSIELFKETLPKLITGDFNPIPQSDYLSFRKTAIHFRKEINDIKQIDLDWPKEKIEKHIRATYMPGFKPPYFIINNRKVELNLLD